MDHNHHSSQAAHAAAWESGTKDKHAGHTTEMFGRKFWICLVLTIPVVAYSGIIETLFGFTALPFPGSEYIPLVFGSAVFFYGGWVFLKGAWRELGSRAPGMMTLISLAILAAYLYSLFVSAVGGGMPLFWELTTLITIMLLGHWLEMRAVSGARGALKELAKLLPDTAELAREDGSSETIPLAELEEDDVVLVRPGAKIPADGLVVEGESEVNESMITGESKPVLKGVGAEVIAGTVSGDGGLKIKVRHIGDNTFLAGVMRLVKEAQTSKSRLQLLSDRAAAYLAFIAVGAGLITFIAWFVAGAEPSVALTRLIAVLAIACPHALGLAIPLVASISTTLAARNGFLVKERRALEMARDINIVLFDKTGTLTKGEYGVTDIFAASGYSTTVVLQTAASADALSEHPTARAIVRKTKEAGISLSSAKEFKVIKGKGVRAEVNGDEVLVGGSSLIMSERFTVPSELNDKAREAADIGKTVVFVVLKGLVVGAIALADIVRDESREAVARLKSRGVRVGMITGDSEGVAEWVAGELGIDEFFARVLPEDKAGKVRLLQSKGFKVAMVGDGINDAPALVQSDVGIAIGAGTNVAIESAGIILVRNDPRDIVKLINLSRRTYSKMIQNLFWATGYNVVALPLAAGVLAYRGIVLEPAVAAILMSLSTIIVAANAVLLRKNFYNSGN